MELMSDHNSFGSELRECSMLSQDQGLLIFELLCAGPGSVRRGHLYPEVAECACTSPSRACSSQLADNTSLHW